jgi:hypothetical protein
VGDLCTATWRGEKYRVECTHSYLLALASALAPEGAFHIDIYERLAGQVAEKIRGCQDVARRVGELLREK